MTENTYLIETRDLVKQYPMGEYTLVALDKVSLNFKKGDFAGRVLMLPPDGSPAYQEGDRIEVAADVLTDDGITQWAASANQGRPLSAMTGIIMPLIPGELTGDADGNAVYTIAGTDFQRVIPKAQYATN